MLLRCTASEPNAQLSGIGYQERWGFWKTQRSIKYSRVFSTTPVLFTVEMKRCSRINRTGIERSQLLTRLNCRSDEVAFDFVCATGAHFLRRIWICS